MKTSRYRYGLEELDGNLAWALFCASGSGDLEKVGQLLAEDPRLVNAQYWYQFPIHMAVREGHEDLVDRLLAAGADPGQSRYTYNSWDKLLVLATERGFQGIVDRLICAMRQRFGFEPRFAAVVEAIKECDRKRAENLIAEDPALIRAADALGNGVVHWSALTRQQPLIDFFISKGAELEAQRADGQTPLLVALNGDYWHRERDLPAGVSRNPWETVYHLLQRGAKYALSIACADGDRHRVDEVLACSPSSAIQLDAGGRSPMSYASRNGHTTIVEQLLNAGANPNRPETNAPTGASLFSACAGNQIETARLLLERGADPNAEVDSSGSCYTIVEFNHKASSAPMKHLLVEYGAQIPPYAMSDSDMLSAVVSETSIVDHDQFIHELIGRDNPELMRAFIEREPDKISNLVLSDIWGGHYPRDPFVISALTSAGLDIDQANWIGRTFLHRCAEKGDVETARIYLDFGVSIDAIEFEQGGTPLAAAARAGKEDMVKLLLDAGANPRAPADSKWAQPLTAAQQGGHLQIVELLRKHLGLSEE